MPFPSPSSKSFKRQFGLRFRHGPFRERRASTAAVRARPKCKDSVTLGGGMTVMNLEVSLFFRLFNFLSFCSLSDDGFYRLAL